MYDDEDEEETDDIDIVHSISPYYATICIDKGGYSAIDHAAANNDEDIICLLLEFGANVLRVNHTLVAQRHHILRRVTLLRMTMYPQCSASNPNPNPLTPLLLHIVGTRPSVL